MILALLPKPESPSCPSCSGRHGWSETTGCKHTRALGVLAIASSHGTVLGKPVSCVNQGFSISSNGLRVRPSHRRSQWMTNHKNTFWWHVKYSQPHANVLDFLWQKAVIPHNAVFAQGLTAGKYRQELFPLFWVRSAADFISEAHSDIPWTGMVLQWEGTLGCVQTPKYPCVQTNQQTAREQLGCFSLSMSMALDEKLELMMGEVPKMTMLSIKTGLSLCRRLCEQRAWLLHLPWEWLGTWDCIIPVRGMLQTALLEAGQTGTACKDSTWQWHCLASAPALPGQ